MTASARASAGRPVARKAGLLGAASLCLAALMGGACASSAPPSPPPSPTPTGPPPEERPYLLHPLEGWEQPVSDAAVELLDEGHAAIEAGAPETARLLAEETVALAARGDRFPPADVLAAEADLLERRSAAALERLGPLAEEHPTYTALQLALGRAADGVGDVVTAFAAFERAAAASDLAYERVAALRPRLAEVLDRRLEDALERAERSAGADEEAVAEAEEALALLQRWLPEEPATLTGAVYVAAARQDRAAELEALRVLTPRAPEIVGEDARLVIERQAELELAVGDSKTGLDLFSDLAARYPDDPRIAERLAFAKFRWRVDQMPPRVATVASAAELQRGDLAVLLYWLVPRVRSARSGQARIASDILDDPRREEIARVLNQGLMDMDASVHRFYPHRPVRRASATDSVLRVLRRFGGATCTPPAAEDDEDGAISSPRICRAAAECGLLRDGEACRPEATISGGEAVDLIRRALAWMAADGAG